MKIIKKEKGFSLLEIILTLGVLLIIVAITFLSFRGLNDSEVLDKTALQLSSIMEEARTRTVGSIEDDRYGVHIEADSATLFKGGTYSSSDPENVVFAFNSQVEVTDISLSDLGSNVIFERLTGKASQTGTTTITLKSDTSMQRFVVVEGTGLVNITD